MDSWAALFERAADFEVSDEEVQEAIRKHGKADD